MSKQSEAKENQGYRKDSPCCQNCSIFSMKVEKVKYRWGGEYTKESEFRCSLGNFKVLKRSWCQKHQWKSE